MLGSVHGASGSAQASSTGEGTRMPWLQLANAVMRVDGVYVMPAAGLTREYRWLPSMAGASPLLSASVMRALS